MKEIVGQPAEVKVSTERAQAKRGVWVVADQALSSAFNLLVGAIAVRLLTIVDFGTFAVYFASYLISRGVFRALLLEPILILYPSESASEHRPIVQGAALWSGLGAGLIALLANFALGNGLNIMVCTAFGAAIAPLFWAESYRVLSTARGKPERAALISFAMLTAFGLVALLLRQRLDNLEQILAVVAASTALAVGLAGGISATSISPAKGYRWIRSHSKVGFPLVGEYLASAGLSYFAILFLAGISVAEAGAFRAGQMLIAPIHMLFVALTQHLVVEGSRLHKGAQPMARLVKAVGSMMAVAGVIVVFVTLSGDFLPRLLLGEAADVAVPVIIPLAIHAALSSVSAVGSGVLRAKNVAEQALKRRLISAVPESLAIAVGATLGGAQGVAIASVVAIFIALPIWSQPILRTLSERQDTVSD